MNIIISIIMVGILFVFLFWRIWAHFEDKSCLEGGKHVLDVDRRGYATNSRYLYHCMKCRREFIFFMGKYQDVTDKCVEQSPKPHAQEHTWTGGPDGCCLYCYKPVLENFKEK